MKATDRLTDALNDIGDDLIRDAEDNVPVILKKKKNGWVKWVALAASILLIVLAVPVGIFAARGYQSNMPAAEISDREGKAAETLPVSVNPAPEDAPGLIEGGEWAYYSARDKDGHVSAEIPARDPADPRYPTEEGKQRPVPEPGMLTAAAWDDNLHYSQWLALFAEFNEKQEPGKFRDTDAYSYRLSDWGLATDRRITVTVRYGGAPVADAYVKLDGNGTVVNARTNANGIAYLFAEPAGALTVKSGQISLSEELNGRTEVEVSLLLSEQSPVSGSAPEPASPAAKRDVIELMLVIDVTGSMDDELVYIQKELENVLDRVVKGNPNTQVKLALLFYRDHGDQEVFRCVDFTDVTDQTAFVELKQILLSERADGGGDLPEAVDEALETAVGKDWSDNTTKLIFHIMDAPAHDEAGARNRFKTAVQTAAKKGIRICPVMASGADRIAEFLCRSEAVMTGGTFVFLTDDSGIGYGHLDPQLPDAVHEHLNHLMVRLILGYHTGEFAEPIPWNEEE